MRKGTRESLVFGERAAAHYQQDKKKARENVAAWQAANPEKPRSYKRAWKQKNPERVLADTIRRRSRLKSNGGTLTAQDIRDAREVACGLCAYCLRPADELTIDHVIPVALDGENAFENIAMACRPCNARKSQRGPLFMLQYL